MALIDELEFCHCDLNRNLNELVRVVKGGEDVTILGCGDVRPERQQEAERYAKAWKLGSALHLPTSKSRTSSRPCRYSSATTAAAKTNSWAT